MIWKEVIFSVKKEEDWLEEFHNIRVATQYHVSQADYKATKSKPNEYLSKLLIKRGSES